MNKLLLKENYSSQNLFEKVNLLTEQQISAISNGLKWTIDNLPSAVLIGGTATIHYISGARFLTPDIDFMVNDIASVKAKLAFDELSYSVLDVGLSYPLGITVDAFNTDYLDSNVGSIKLNKLILQTSLRAFIGGYDVNIINPELLAIMKLNLGRDKDINDGFALLSSGKVDKNKYNDYLYQLKDSLEDYESLIMYKNMIQ